MKLKIKNLEELKKSFNGINDNPHYHYYTHEDIVNKLKDNIKELYKKDGIISVNHFIKYGEINGEPIERDCEFRLDKYDDDKNEVTYYYNGVIG